MPIALQPNEAATLQQQVANLQAQINRFNAGLPVTGTLDLATANAAMILLVQRYTGAYINDPRNIATRDLYLDASKNVGNPLPWVQAHLAETVNTIRDFADFSGKPPVGGSAPFPVSVTALVILGVAAALFVVVRPWRFL